MNARFLHNAMLLGMTYIGLTHVGLTHVGLTAAIGAPSTTSRSPASVAQAPTVSGDKGSALPWAIAGGVGILAIGGAAGVYTIGRRSGKQEARIHNAVDEYRTLADLAPSQPSVLEEELRALKSAVPAVPHPAVPHPAAQRSADVDSVFAPAVPAFDPVVLKPVTAPMPAPMPTSIPTATPVTIATTNRHPAPSPPPIDGEFVSPAPATPAALVTTQPGSLAEPSRSRLPQMSVVEAMMQDLRHKDVEKRRKAIWDLGQRGDTRAVQPLVDLMLDADSKQRSLILSALSEIGTRTLKPMGRALAISLQDENPEVRKNAIRDLTRVYDLIAQISQMVQRATDDPDAEVRDTATWALKQLNRIRPTSVEGANNAGNIAQSAVSRPESMPSARL